MWLFLTLSLAHAGSPSVEFIDSRDDNSITWLLIDDCAVPLKKTKLKDDVYIDAQIEKICHTFSKIKESGDVAHFTNKGKRVQ